MALRLANCKPSNVCLFQAKFYQYLLELRVTTSMQRQPMANNGKLTRPRHSNALYILIDIN